MSKYNTDLSKLTFSQAQHLPCCKLRGRPQLDRAALARAVVAKAAVPDRAPPERRKSRRRPNELFVESFLVAVGSASI